MQSSNPQSLKQKIEFVYDYMGRRNKNKFSYIDFDPMVNDWIVDYDRANLYDGWNLIAEVVPDPSGMNDLIQSLHFSTLAMTYAWMSDGLKMGS